MPPEILIAQPGTLATKLAGELASARMHATTGGRRATVALPGGSVAETLFPPLLDTDLDWRHFEFFFVDERSVEPTSQDSNFGLANALLLGPADIPAAHVHRMHTDDPHPQAATADYGRRLAAIAGSPPTLDLILLGVGADGHVASLFPGSPLLEETRLAVAWLDDAPKPPPARMTLTLPTLCRGRRLVVAAFGDRKAPAIAASVRDPDSTLPLARVLRCAARPLLLLDDAAASRLPPSGSRHGDPPDSYVRW